MFLVTFFSPNLRGRAEKKTKCPKKKKTLAQCPRLPNRQMTSHPNLFIVLSAVILLFMFYQTMQLPVTTKVWLFLVLDLSSRAKNVLEWPKRWSKTPLLSAVYVRWFQQKGSWLLVFSDQTRLLPANSCKEGVEVFSKLWRICMNGEHHAF